MTARKADATEPADTRAPRAATGATPSGASAGPTASSSWAGLLHHVEIYVSDLTRSAAFWQWLTGELGYETLQHWKQGLSLRLGPTYLVFVQTPKAHQQPRYHRCRTGLNHLAFHATSRRQVDELTDALRCRGVPILYADRHPYAGGPDHYAVFFEDPDRIKVEVVAPQAGG